VLANAWQNKELTDTAGNTYKCTEAHGAVGAGSSVDLDVESVDTGFTTNLESGTDLTWTAPPAGSDSTATLAKDLTGGADLETDAEGRTRLIARLRDPPASGNVADWVDAIEAVQPGNLKAWVWPQRFAYPNGFNTTDYCATKRFELGTDKFILSTDDLYTDIDTAVDAALPALIYRNSRQLTLANINKDVTLTVTLGLSATEDQKCDWDAEGNKRTVASNDASGPNIVASGNITSPTVTNGIAAGDKVVIFGTEATVSSVVNATTFAVTDWPDGWPTAINALAGYNILSGGGFIGYQTDYDNSVTGTGLYGAVQDYMESRAPNALYNGAQGQIEGFESSILLQQIESACFVTGEGVITDVAIAAPAADQVHTAELGNTANIYVLNELSIYQVFV
jgi:hypothetical protein